MKTQNHITTIILLAVSVIRAFSQQSDSKVTISFNCPSVPTAITMKGDYSSLFHYANQTHEYRGIYYLFTDEHLIEIDSESKLSKGCTLSFDPNDTQSVWLSGDTLPNDAIITQDRLSQHTLSFKWNERAHLLINANDKGSADKNRTLLLIVLPMPPEDTLFSSIENNIIVDKRDGILNGNVTLRRTGRLVVDSIYVEGKKAPTTFRNGSSDRDTPYYRNQVDACVEIELPWTEGIKDIRLTVFFRRFNSNGTISRGKKDLQIELFGDSFFEKYWWAFVALGIAILMVTLILLIPRIRHSNIIEETKQLRTRVKQLTGENERLQKNNRKTEQTQEKHIAVLQAQIRDLEAKIKCLSRPTKAAIDEATFKQKCEQLIEEIERIREPLHGNSTMDELNEKLRVLEKIVIITKQ